jgi:hypothetical protein
VGLSMAERKAVTKQMARRYQGASKAEKGKMLDELCALTGWTRRHARRALARALLGRAESPRRPRPRIYGQDVAEPLRLVWRRSAARRGSVWRRSWPRRSGPWNVTGSSSALARSATSCFRSRRRAIRRLIPRVSLPRRMAETSLRSLAKR